MKVLICERCGANELHEEENYFVCNYCGSKFLKETKSKHFSNTGNTFAKANSLDQNSENLTSGISLNSDIERLLQKCKTDPKNAKKYANLILDIDPDNKEAYKYL